MTTHESYSDTIQQGQDTWTGMVQSFTDQVSKSFAPMVSPFTSVDPNAAIDQVFDFWSKALDMQREAAKQIVGATVSAGEKMRSQVESFTKADHQA